MNSAEVFEQTLNDALITTNIPYDQFLHLLHGAQGGYSFTEEQTKTWYTQLEKMDKETLKKIRRRFEHFINKVRRSQLRELETSQLSESFKLEELINNLYTIDDLLSTKLQLLDNKVTESNNQLRTFDEQLEQTIGNSTSSSEPLSSILQTIDKYRRAIDGTK
ncbi:hypothetical protein TPHA_0K01510 [Tetrapisispora phaffii CBS 4417]|uniref:Uncharacterized protein n=1 Tax=Tetrapisispora phaffii (strain ATCC 24235 / CBS 4417 / NBRC 1672 / NRRL Y-8282 / UCD 70-5) TaxID=1071381 RepID=G8BZF6_TETPH|nr:hypothetical protein TPHA_0K01510 [Tetrapisispora phaffii CBS 4417]CCE65284.1 hypothetical protein TPHA_0K01510 [Tetrapisispora phaffii CBS 4417]